jgi:hypothetical protein
MQTTHTHTHTYINGYIYIYIKQITHADYTHTHTHTYINGLLAHDLVVHKLGTKSKFSSL